MGEAFSLPRFAWEQVKMRKERGGIYNRLWTYPVQDEI